VQLIKATLEKKSETRTFRYSFSERKTGLPDKSG